MSPRTPWLAALLLLPAAGAGALGSPSLDELLKTSGEPLPDAPKAPAASGDEVRAALLLRAASADDKDPVWPGYRVLDSPVLFYGRDAVYVVDAAGSRRLAVDPPEPRLPAGAYRFDAPFQGRRVFVLHPDPALTPLDHVRTTVHERFHAYQARFLGPASDGRALEAPDALAWALGAVEQESLLEALRGGAGWERAAREFVAVRAERRGASAPASADAEDALESLEGLAFYVDTRFYHRAGGGGAPERDARLQERLTPSFDDYVMTRDRYYATGAGMAFLLDRRGARGWKRAAAAGRPLTKLLADSLGPIPPGLAAEAKARRGFDGFLRQAESRLGAARDAAGAALAAFRASPGLKVYLGYPSDYGGSADRRRPDVRTAAGNLGDFRSLQMNGPGLQGAIADRAVLFEEAGFAFHLDGDPVVSVDGAPLAPRAGRRTFHSLTVSADGFRLDARRAGVVDWTEERLSVTWER